MRAGQRRAELWLSVAWFRHAYAALMHKICSFAFPIGEESPWAYIEMTWCAVRVSWLFITFGLLSNSTDVIDVI